jgi:aryl-alcohol dehydrogenase-like predicted oxidoreductase
LRGDVRSLLCHVWKRGGRTVDTAANYRKRRALSDVASALAAAVSSEIITTSSNIHVTAKAGYVGSADVLTALVDAKIVAADDVVKGQHVLSSTFVRWEIDRAAETLGRAVDTFFLHNPEEQLARLSRSDLLYTIRHVFATLEEASAARKIQQYGVATWRSLFNAGVTVDDLRRAAVDVGGDAHHFRAIQLPVNILIDESAAAAMEGHGPIVDAAASGMQVFASAPLAGGELTRLITRDIAKVIADQHSPAQAAFQFVRSIPGISVILVGVSTPEHFDELFNVCDLPTLATEHVHEILRLTHRDAGYQ